MKTWFPLTVLLAVFAVQADTFYKWTDDQGVTHYGKRPPQGQPAQSVNVSTGEKRSAAEDAEEEGGASDADGQGPSPEELRAEAQATEEELARAKEQQAALTEKNCAIARKNQFNLKHRDRIRITDEETGEQRYLTPTELQEWRERTQRELEEYCN